jgi:hypothetical protein
MLSYGFPREQLGIESIKLATGEVWSHCYCQTCCLLREVSTYSNRIGALEMTMFLRRRHYYTFVSAFLPKS